MKKFELYEQYLKQNEGIAKARKAYDDKVKAAEQALADAKAKLDEVVHVEITTGAQKTKDKAAARKAVEEAEKDLAQTKQEREAAYKYFSGAGGSITRPQVVQAYLNEYVPSVKAEHLPVIQERMKQGIDLILSAFYDFQQLKREYKDISREVKEIDRAAVRYGEQKVSYAIPNPFGRVVDSGINIPELVSQLDKIANGAQLPDSATYYKQPLKEEN
ncbi:hypothetical protein BpJC7_26270 [Weizmannia acidilactici]|uniref:Uncharacterized protein n=1 Tax=Weizmannia acidilactici TaxID=2607726 RepID=A0A5J4JQH5_9BACI|nr:hypothetical protein [Weizmannia acidilactici]GER71324.1 hypothetical protein BpJC7_26270 [Weizmannia acidilactici]